MNNFLKATLVASSVIFGSCVLTACTQTTNSMFGDDRSQLLLVSEETLNDEAKQAYDEVINQAKANGTLNADENFSKRVDMISKRLIDYVPELRADCKNWNWEVNTIKDPTVNAWCMPGGKICVYTGLNDTLNLTDDELASIIGHEISHALKEHSREKKSQASLQSGLTTVAKILGVKKAEGYNQAALLLSDNNTFCGIDIAKFGESISIIKERNTIENESILKQFDDAMVMFKRYYQYEEIKTAYRKTVEILPENAFREALVNAIIHRAWDVKACINVAMFEDRIEITSPGGLPQGLDESEYLKGGVSILRNRILGSVFYRLHLIEHFGSGVKRIMDEYIGNMTKPQFFCSENAVKVILPVLKQDNLLTPDENSVYTLVKKGYASSTDITKNCPFGKNKVVNILKILVTQGYIRQTGNGRGTRYSL